MNSRAKIEKILTFEFSQRKSDSFFNQRLNFQMRHFWWFSTIVKWFDMRVQFRQTDLNPLHFGWLFMATFWLVFYPRGWWYLGKFLMIYGLPSSLVVVMMRVATTKNTWFCFAPKKEVAWLLKPLSTKETSAAREGQFQRDISNQKPEK